MAAISGRRSPLAHRKSWGCCGTNIARGWSGRSTARSALGELPLLADEVMNLELIELHPFTALEMLFSRESFR